MLSLWHWSTTWYARGKPSMPSLANRARSSRMLWGELKNSAASRRPAELVYAKITVFLFPPGASPLGGTVDKPGTCRSVPRLAAVGATSQATRRFSPEARLRRRTRTTNPETRDFQGGLKRLALQAPVVRCSVPRECSDHQRNAVQAEMAVG